MYPAHLYHCHYVLPRIHLMLLVIIMGATSAVEAQSIWAQRDPWRAHQFSDTSARRLGDLVTVLIQENTGVANRDQRQMAKDSDAGFKFDFASSSDSGAANVDLETNAASNREFNGKSQYSVEQQFLDSITAQIVEILPNGCFVIKGTRTRHVSGEVRQLTVSGIIRPLDIRPNNTIASRLIADFEICYSGTGPQSSFSNQGWLGRIGNRLWPF